MKEALSRTLLLMRTDLKPEISDEQLLAALAGTVVAISADARALVTHSGQSAIVAAALNMARCGHEVWLDFPDVPLDGNQPPLVGSGLLGALLETGRDLLPGWRFHTGRPEGAVDLDVVFGDASRLSSATCAVSLNADDWAATLMPVDEGRPWEGESWPVGGLAAAAAAAGEAFKASMRKLSAHARAPNLFAGFYAPAEQATLRLAPADTPRCAELGVLDVISGGAIANALLFALLRLPGVSGASRFFDDDRSALSNLNRNALLRRSRLERHKVEDLASFEGALNIEPVVLRYGATPGDEVPLRGNVLVGVDDIPSRWKVQRLCPGWLGVGATDRFSVQVSFHDRALPCVACLHPEDAPFDGVIPTAAFVSFWSGLLLATALLRHLAGASGGPSSQQTFFSPLRPESWDYSMFGVGARENCPICAVARAAA